MNDKTIKKADYSNNDNDSDNKKTKREIST